MGANYQICMTPGHFVGIGNSVFSSYQYISTFNTMHYTCGGGFQGLLRALCLFLLFPLVYLSNQNCMKAAWTGPSAEQLSACRTKYEVTANVQTSNACM